MRDSESFTANFKRWLKGPIWRSSNSLDEASASAMTSCGSIVDFGFPVLRSEQSLSSRIMATFFSQMADLLRAGVA